MAGVSVVLGTRDWSASRRELFRSRIPQAYRGGRTGAQAYSGRLGTIDDPATERDLSLLSLKLYCHEFDSPNLKFHDVHHITDARVVCALLMRSVQLVGFRCPRYSTTSDGGVR
jgi:hypothetical protein